MGRLIISEERQQFILELFKNSDIKFTDYQKEVLSKFLNKPELIKLETEYPIVHDIIQQLKKEKEEELIDTPSVKHINEVENLEIAPRSKVKVKAKIKSVKRSELKLL